MLGLVERLETIETLGFADWPPLAGVHPAARRLLGSEASPQTVEP